MHIVGLVESLGTSILVSRSPESSRLPRTHMWRKAPRRHHGMAGPGQGGEAGSLVGEQGHQGGTQEAA